MNISHPSHLQPQSKWFHVWPAVCVCTEGDYWERSFHQGPPLNSRHRTCTESLSLASSHFQATQFNSLQLCINTCTIVLLKPSDGRLQCQRAEFQTITILMSYNNWPRLWECSLFRSLTIQVPAALSALHFHRPFSRSPHIPASWDCRIESEVGAPGSTEESLLSFYRNAFLWLCRKRLILVFPCSYKKPALPTGPLVLYNKH